MPSLYLHVLTDIPGQRDMALTPQPLHIGRAKSNHLSVEDDHVSWMHAMVWLEFGTAWIKDLGSTNGTFVNGERVTGGGGVQLAPGDKVNLGPNVQLELRGTADRLARRSFGLVDDTTQRTHEIRSDRFVIGDGPDADLTASTVTDPVVLMVHGQELWMGVGGEDRQVAVGETLKIGPVSLRVVVIGDSRQPTTADQARYTSYVLAATLAGPTGPEAVVTCDQSGSRCELTGNRAVLLYVLGKAWRAESELPTVGSIEERGWRADEDVATDIWGRAAHNFDANNLNVLVYRTRDALRKAGIEPWCIEKRKGFTRLRVNQVTID
jgi:hypothetical protein